MKKIITSSLITAIISNNIVCADELENEIEDINENIVINTTTDLELEKEEGIENQEKVINTEGEKQEEKKVTDTFIQYKTTNITEVSASDFNGLQDALNNTGNKIINITNDIEFTGDLIIPANNKYITINGNGNRFLLNKNQVNVKSEGAKLNNIKFEGYTNQAISVYNTKNVTLEKIELIGTVDQSSCGIDIGASGNNTSSVILSNITSKNHKSCGIRVKNGSSVEFKGGNIHINDKQDLCLIDEEGKENKIIDTNNQYVKLNEKIDETNKKTYIYYGIPTNKVVNDFKTLKEALQTQNSTITLGANITLEEDIDITKGNITINGNGYTIKSSNKQNSISSKDTYKLSIKAPDTTIENLKFENYISNALTVYSAENITLSNLTFTGNEVQLPNEERSKAGIDIYNSTVKLDNITSKNHLYRGIQVRNGSIVEIVSKNTHENDSIHMQTIKSTGEENNTIKDVNEHYIAGTEKENNGKTTVDYYSKNYININSAKDFIKNLQNSGNVLYLKKDIVFNESDLEELKGDTELIVSPNITIIGDGNTIDLSNLATITLKGNDIRLENLIIKNSKDIGVNIYNSRDVYLDKVSVENSKRYGIFVNGSSVKLNNCATRNNDEGGIMITRFITLRGNSYMDSYVEVIGSIKHDEPNINVAVKNLEMIDGYFQDNKFIAPNNIYNKYENDAEYKVLSDYYLDLFNIVGEERNKKYKEQSIDYMIIQNIINVKENNEVLNSDGMPIRLVGDGIVDETENIEKLIEYAASHGRELYFPKGTYKITRDIDLSKINLPALSNFTITGDKDGLAVIDGSSSVDKMLRITNEEYKSQMNYVNINNIVFNNIGIEFNGPYKKGISLNNNAFINGKYTREVDSSGNITEATMEPYIIAKNTKYSIENNIFLRDKNNPGRGISTYRTKNTTIRNNYFGNLEGISDASSMLPKDVIDKLNMIKNSSNDLNLSGSQGNFFTAINNERYDENIDISNNYFNMDKTRNITSDFGENVSVSGINVSKEGQRRDHIIYSKGYDGLNIYGNYFKGMETGAAGGVKIRNGKNAYIGSNHFDDVPLLTYIYGDLTKSESLLYDTTIYNNLFHCKTNFGQEGTGILYYQSFKDGDNLTFNDGDTWEDAFGDVKNFVMYKNQFLSDDRDQITISGRAKTAYSNKQFLAYGNKYLDNNEIVNYNKGNLTLSESNESDIVSKLNSGYSKYNTVAIPLTPAKSDYTYINKVIEDASSFYEDIKNKGLIGSLGGQYSETVANELKSLIDETLNLINSKSLSQYDTNKRLTLIEEVLNKLKSSINAKGDAPIIEGLDKVELKIGDKFDPLSGVKATDKEDGDITKDIKVSGSVDVNVEGKYELTYTVTDSDGNKTEVKREVIVRSNEAPVIEGLDKVELKIGDKFDPLLGVKAIDKEDGNITNDINVSGSVDVNVEGRYQLIYTVTDSDGNKAEVKREVIVRSNEAPIIEGLDKVELKIGDKFDPLSGVKATDKEDGDITKDIKVSGSVDVNIEGKYELTYIVTDSDGNKTEAKREVVVNHIKIEINNAPTIQANDKTIKVGDKFNPLDGVTAFDAEDGDITDKIKVVSNNVNTSKNGNYEVVYEVIDSKGVITSKVISVIVVSDNKPIIIGAEDIEIIEGSNFDPMEGVSAFDYEDGDITEKIIILGSVNTNKPGEYNIIYRVSDKDNNSTEFVRKVLVYDNKFNLIDNPKTGEENILVWLVTGALALIGIVLLNKKKK